MIFWFFCLVLCVAFVWRLRGGALATLLGVKVGTDATRALCAALIALPFAAPNSLPVLLPAGLYIALFVGEMIAGWAPFQEMGLIPANMPEQSWLRWLPLHLGLKIDTFWHDFVGMAEAGVFFMLPMFIVGLWCGHHAWLLLLAGLGFAPAYAAARLNLPAIPKFAEGQSWGEVFAGAIVGAGLFVVFT
jgi:hypothetical protein